MTPFATHDVSKIRRYARLCAVLWTMLIAGLFVAYVYEIKENINTIASSMAQVTFEKDMQFMRPSVTGKACLDCHYARGFKEGDRKNGISVSLSMVPIVKSMKGEIQESAIFQSLIWSVGIVLIWLATKRIIRTTEMQLYEQLRLVESEQRFRSLADTAPVLIWMADQTKQCTYFNKRWCDFTGHAHDELVGDGWARDVHPDDLTECIRIYEMAFDTREPFSMEYRLRRHDGEYRWIIDNGVPRWTEETTFLGYIGSCLDITERKMAEFELRDRKKHYRAIVDAFDGQIYICSQEYRIVFMNGKLIERTGRNAVGENCFKALHDLDAICPWCVNERVFKGEMVRWEVQSPKDDRWYYVVNSPIYNEDGSIYKQAMIQDVTGRKLLEQQFHQAQKLESLGVLAGGIAHDFNNILTVILGYCFLAKERFESGENSSEPFIQHIETAANRAADLCRQMLSYAGKNQLVQTRISLWLLVDEVVKMLQASINKNVTIRLDLQQSLPEIMGDTGQIQQIVMNLIINAAEAIGDKNGTIVGRLTQLQIGTDTAEVDLFGAEIPAGGYVCFEVTDTGCGMNEETQNKIFEPFFTTKFTGRGLGMSAILGIIKAHSGMLQLTSRPGVGTTFKVYFPCLEPAGQAVTAATVPAPPLKASGTILLVDDEQVLRNMAVDLFETLGFSVVTARHGGEALEIYRERGSEIDVILLDMIMPVMGGIETYHNLRSISPHIPIVICSGYGEESASATIENDAHAGFVHKPYKPVEMMNMLTMMIG
jgi:PAS domain S-box-containing protein